MNTIFIVAAAVTASVAVISLLTVSIGTIVDAVEKKMAQCEFDSHVNQTLNMVKE